MKHFSRFEELIRTQVALTSSSDCSPLLESSYTKSKVARTLLERYVEYLKTTLPKPTLHLLGTMALSDYGSFMGDKLASFTDMRTSFTHWLAHLAESS